MTLAWAGLAGAIIWLITDLSWEPLVTAIGFVATIVSLIYREAKQPGNSSMHQNGAKKFHNYQAGGDISINRSKE